MATATRKQRDCWTDAICCGALVTFMSFIAFFTILLLVSFGGKRVDHLLMMNATTSDGPQPQQQQQPPKTEAKDIGALLDLEIKKELDDVKLTVEDLAEQVEIGLTSIGTNRYLLKSAANNASVFVPVGHNNFLTAVNWDFGANVTNVGILFECGAMAVHQDSLVDCWMRMEDHPFFVKVHSAEGPGYLSIDVGPEFMTDTQRFHAQRTGGDDGGPLWTLSLQEDPKRVLSVLQSGYVISNTHMKRCNRCDAFYLAEATNNE